MDDEKEFGMAEKSSPQRYVSLSPKADEDLSLLAAWKGMTLSAYLRGILESHHESPGTQALLRRAKEEMRNQEPIEPKRRRKLQAE